jgi:hypothetical protein
MTLRGPIGRETLELTAPGLELAYHHLAAGSADRIQHGRKQPIARSIESASRRFSLSTSCATEIEAATRIGTAGHHGLCPVSVRSSLAGALFLRIAATSQHTKRLERTRLVA